MTSSPPCSPRFTKRIDAEIAASRAGRARQQQSCHRTAALPKAAPRALRPKTLNPPAVLPRSRRRQPWPCGGSLLRVEIRLQFVGTADQLPIDKHLRNRGCTRCSLHPLHRQMVADVHRLEGNACAVQKFLRVRAVRAVAARMLTRPLFRR